MPCTVAIVLLGSIFGVGRLAREPDGEVREYTNFGRPCCSSSSTYSLSLGFPCVIVNRTSRCDNRIHQYGMALVVFFRGINVGGHRTLRPSLLAKELAAYGVVNVGAAGTFVVRKPGLHASFIAELRRKLPFEAKIALCDGSDLIQLEMENPFGSEPSSPDVVLFASVLSNGGHCKAPFPIAIPEGEKWLVRIMGSNTGLCLECTGAT